MAGASAERQENGFIKKINDAIAKNGGSITVVAGLVRVKDVVKAAKYTGRQVGGSEPYTDVQLFLKKGKPINISMKGESAPSLAGGGLKGLELAVPGIAAKFMKAAWTELKMKKKLKDGDKVPDVYGKISNANKIKIVVGNEAMGGPIDYMYIGPMDVIGTVSSSNTMITMNGKMFEAVEYAKSHDLYFRLRARREDQRFLAEAKDAAGIPKIYGKSPSRGDSAGRIVVTDSVPTTGVIVSI